MIDKIISYIEFLILNHRFKQISRLKEFIGLRSSKSIGIIYYVDDFKVYQQVHSFISELQANKILVSSIGIYSTKLIPSWSNKTINNALIQEKKYINLQTINSSYVENFIKKDFDILIDFSINNKFLPLYIAALSKSKLKISMDSDIKKKYFDMLIKITSEDVKDYIYQLKYYLSNIKN